MARKGGITLARERNLVTNGLTRLRGTLPLQAAIIQAIEHRKRHEEEGGDP